MKKNMKFVVPLTNLASSLTLSENNVKGNLSIIVMALIIVSSLGVNTNVYAKLDDTTSKQQKANVGPMAVPDTMQSGYDVHYSGTGTIQSVSTTIDTVPGVSIPDTGNFVAFLLNTGDLTTCSGFMQDGILETASNSWSPIYMNGQSSCFTSNITPAITINQNNKVSFTIQHSGTTTTYTVNNISTGKTATTSVTALSTWNKNNFETMTEATSVGPTMTSTTYDSSKLVDPSGSTVNIVSSGNPNLTTPTEYGGACTDSVYSPGAWQNSATYGYSEPSAIPNGHCVFNWNSIASIGSGSYSNANGMKGGPDNSLTQLYGGNLNDGAYVIVTLGQQFTGTLKTYGYSHSGYSSHVKVDTSSDCSTFSNIYSQTWSPSGTNTPSWVTIGSVSNIKCVKVTAIDDTGFSADVFMDALRVGN